MREILFRVWDEQIERFIYFGLSGYPFNEEIGEGYVLQYAEQYTGLTDKNGNKIFEGDIVEYMSHRNEKRNADIVWSCGTMGFVIRGEAYYPRLSEMEIIGNIHEKEQGE